MKYLCPVYCDEGLLHSLPDSPEDAECMAYAESLQGPGECLRPRRSNLCRPPPQCVCGVGA